MLGIRLVLEHAKQASHRLSAPLMLGQRLLPTLWSGVLLLLVTRSRLRHGPVVDLGVRGARRGIASTSLSSLHLRARWAQRARRRTSGQRRGRTLSLLPLSIARQAGHVWLRSRDPQTLLLLVLVLGARSAKGAFESREAVLVLPALSFAGSSMRGVEEASALLFQRRGALQLGLGLGRGRRLRRARAVRNHALLTGRCHVVTKARGSSQAGKQGTLPPALLRHHTGL